MKENIILALGCGASAVSRGIQGREACDDTTATRERGEMPGAE